MTKHSHVRRACASVPVRSTCTITVCFLLALVSVVGALPVDRPLIYLRERPGVLLLLPSDPSPQTLPYIQDFSTLASSSTVYPAGWQGWILGGGSTAAFRTTAPSDNTNLLANSTSATTTSGVHNYNGKVGMLATGSLDPAIALAINTAGFSSINVAFDIMTIRNQKDATNTRINQVDLQYRVCPAPPTECSGAFASVSGNSSGVYENNTTNQTSPGTTNPQKLESKNFVLPSAANDQPNVQLRWVQRDASGGGSRPSFAIDNLAISGTAACAPPSVVTHPADAAITYGNNASLTAAGSDGTSVLWEISADGGAIWSSTGVTTPTITVNTPDVAQSGNKYRAVFTSTCDSTLTATTNPATLTVSPLQITAAIDVNTRTYDGTSGATLAGCSLIGVVDSDDISCDATSAIASFVDANAGIDKPVTAAGLSTAGTDAGNYSFDGNANGVGTIEKAPTTVVVEFEAGPYVFRGSPFIATAGVSGAGGLNESLPVTYVGDCTNVTVPNGCTATAIYAESQNHLGSNGATSVSVTPAPTLIVPDGNIDGTNNDCADSTYTALLKDAVTNVPIANVALKMTIGSQSATATTGADGVASFNLVLSQPAGVVSQAFEIDQAWSDPNRLPPPAVSRSFTVIGDPGVEPGSEADSFYTGSLFFWTTSPTSSTATLTLSATLRDVADKCSDGDITKARVSFFISSNGGGSFSPVNNAQNLPVGLVDPGDPGVGVASAISQYNIGTSQSVTLIVRVVVGGEYEFSSSEYDIPITIGKPGTANSLMGGGKLKNDGSPFAANGYLGINSISATFGGQVTHNKKGTNPQGQMTVYVRSCNFANGGVDAKCVASDPSTHHVYSIKSNSISELALIGGSASFGAKTNVSEIMPDGTKVTLDGGNSMQLLFTPYGMTLPPNNAGNPIGTTCTFTGGCASIVIFRSSAIGGGTWYSSSWGQPAGKPLQTWLKKVVNGTVAVQ